MSFKKQVRDFASTNRTVMSVFATQESKDDVIAAYVAGAKHAAGIAIELGYVFESLTPAMTPAQAVTLQTAFARVKEIVDHE